jgi:hypothetical protein
MYLRVDLAPEPPAVELREREDCTRLHVEAHGAPTSDAGHTSLDRALRDSGFGALDGAAGGDGKEDTHALLGIDVLRTAAGRDRAAGWEKDFDAMIDYARTKGWTVGDHVRAHVVWSPTT